MMPGMRLQLLLPSSEILRPDTVMSFLSVYPNETVTEDILLRQCRESELRLAESGYVYESSLQIVPPT